MERMRVSKQKLSPEKTEALLLGGRCWEIAGLTCPEGAALPMKEQVCSLEVGG